MRQVGLTLRGKDRVAATAAAEATHKRRQHVRRAEGNGRGCGRTGAKGRACSQSWIGECRVRLESAETECGHGAFVLPSACFRQGRKIAYMPEFAGHSRRRSAFEVAVPAGMRQAAIRNGTGCEVGLRVPREGFIRFAPPRRDQPFEQG